MYEIKVDEAETLCPECGKLLRGIRVRQSGAISASVFEAILADYRGRYPRVSVNADGWLLVEECQTNHTAALPATSPETDRAALVALYHHTKYWTYWVRDDNWLSEAPIGEWYGVETDANGRVISLDLGGNGLSGRIPRELGNLGKLERLDLSNNRLGGEIPRELGNLGKLEQLDLGNNRLAGEIPRELGNLGNLEVLDLHSNELDGEIPRELGNLGKLERLNLHTNQLSGEIPRELGNLDNLIILELAINQLTGEIPIEVCDLANLKKLNLVYNQLDEAVLLRLIVFSKSAEIYFGDFMEDLQADMDMGMGMDTLELKLGLRFDGFIEDISDRASIDKTYLQRLGERVNDSLRTLTEQEASVLRLRFGIENGLPHTLESIGREFGISRERIQQIEKRALLKLNDFLDDDDFLPF